MRRIVDDEPAAAGGVWLFAWLRLGGARAAVATMLAVVLTAMWASSARADGKAYFVAKPSAEMPGQQALICYENGVETLAIETRLVGEGTECAWVVPLPARPEVSPATAGVFPSLRAMFVPQVTTYSGWTGVGVVLVLIGLTLVYSGGWRGIGITFVLLILGFLALMPTLGKARGSGGPIAGVSVVDRQLAGSFEVVTLEASKGDSLLAWLKDNGFALSERDAPVIDAYIKENWVFVASKLRHEPGRSNQETTPHPLVFRFATDRAVYPMRLTGTQSGKLDLELYVFGEGTASVNGMKVESAGPVDRDQVILQYRRPVVRADRIVLEHAGIEALTGSAKHATKLVGAFTPEMMKRDIEVEWGAPSVVGRTAMARGHAIWRGIDVGLGVLGVGLMMTAAAMAFVPGEPTPRSRKRGQVLLGVLVLSGVAGMAVAAAPRTVEVKRWRPVVVEWSALWNEAWSRAEERKKKGEAVTTEWLRGEVAALLAGDEYRFVDKEDLKPAPREEDSPGNYTLRVVGKDVYLVPVNDGGQQIDDMNFGTGMSIELAEPEKQDEPSKQGP